MIFWLLLYQDKSDTNTPQRPIIPYVALAGEQEMKDDRVTLKQMATGEQTSVTIQELIAVLA